MPVSFHFSHGLLLAARLLLAILFLIFGWRKLRDYSGTVNQMVQLGVPTPVLATVVATFMELPVGFAVAVGALARLSALLMFFTPWERPWLAVSGGNP